MSKKSENYSNKIYLKTLAKEHHLHSDTYISIMEQYDKFLMETYNITIQKLKGKPLMVWQVDLLRRLNPTDFELTTMKELDEFYAWHEWISKVLLSCKVQLEVTED